MQKASHNKLSSLISIVIFSYQKYFRKNMFTDINMTMGDVNLRSVNQGYIYFFRILTNTEMCFVPTMNITEDTFAELP